MEEYHQITLDEWTQWKEDIRNKLHETAQNFVYIGYRLKQIRDSGMFGGAADVFEFAQNEYGLGKSTVSRFIAINEKYSKDGNSLELKDEYKGFSSSKLSEMLSLPDSECELITEKTTIKDIRELKSFDRQQADTVESHSFGLNDPLDYCIEDYFRGKKEMLNKVLDLLFFGQEMKAAETMNPSGSGTHSKGLCFLFMYEPEKGIKYKLITKPAPVPMTWHEFLQDHVWKIYAEATESDDPYSAYYGEEAVATSQQKEAESQEAQQPEEIHEEEKPVNEPVSEESEVVTSESATSEHDSEIIEEAEKPENTEEETDEEPESLEPQQPEPVATSQQDEDVMNPPEDPEEVEADQKDEIKNPAAFRNAKDALVRVNEAFNEGKYQRVLDMADAFIMHLERALR